MNLYHATSVENARLIIDSAALEPRSGKKHETAYLCMSSNLEGAKTLKSKASDIIFKLTKGRFNPDDFECKGAGQEEYRTTKSIAVSDLLFRRSLGTDNQMMWRSCSEFRIWLP